MTESTFARETSIAVMLCDAHECFFDFFLETNELKECSRIRQKRADCPAYSLVKGIKQCAFPLYQEWKKIVEAQDSPTRSLGINTLIFYGIAKIYSTYGFIIPIIDEDSMNKAKQLEVAELEAGIQELFDEDLEELTALFGTRDQLIDVLAIFKAFADASKNFKEYCIFQIK